MTTGFLSYVVATSAYALLGLALGAGYRVFVRLRDETPVQLGTLTVSFLGAVPLVSWPDLELGDLTIIYDLGWQGSLFLVASLFHLPVTVYIILCQWQRLLERITSPGRTDDRRRRPVSAREEWRCVQRHLEVLARHPLNLHHRQELAKTYLRLGFLDSAIGEYRKAIECVDRGYAHSQLLYKTSRLLVEHRKDIGSALPVLRRLIRLYPRSYFAAYARRVINHHEARHGTTGAPRDRRSPKEGGA